jgi:hypothetical protein
MKKLNFLTFVGLLLLCPFLSNAQTNRVLSGVISTKGSPKKGVVVFDLKHPEVRDTTNEDGKYKLSVYGQVHHLGIQPLDAIAPIHAHLHHRNARKFDFDTEQDVGYFTWRATTAIQYSNSFFSTYQSGGNNNNQSTLLINIAYNNNFHKKRFTIDNDVKILFGQNHTAVPLSNPTTKEIENKYLIAKSSDLLSATSKVGYNMRHNVFLTVLTNFQSQFTKSYADPYAEEKGKELITVSDFLSPATFNLGIGLDYKPNRYFSLYLSPLNLDAMIVKNKDLRPNYNVFSDNGIVPKMGAFLNMDWNHVFFKKIFYSTKLQMGTNYRKSPTHPEAERPGAIDIQMWKNTLSYKINNHISLSFSAVVRYDEDIKFKILKDDKKTGAFTNIRGPRTQYFQNFGINVSYNFENHKRKDHKEKPANNSTNIGAKPIQPPTPVIKN